MDRESSPCILVGCYWRLLKYFLYIELKQNVERSNEKISFFYKEYLWLNIRQMI